MYHIASKSVDKILGYSDKNREKNVRTRETQRERERKEKRYGREEEPGINERERRDREIDRKG